MGSADTEITGAMRRQSDWPTRAEIAKSELPTVESPPLSPASEAATPTAAKPSVGETPASRTDCGGVRDRTSNRIGIGRSRRAAAEDMAALYHTAAP